MRRLFAILAIVLVFAFIGLFVYRPYSKRDRSIAAQNVHRGPILIPGVPEPEEMQVEPISVETPTPPERMLGEAMQQAGNNSNPAALQPALNRILAKYPDYSDGYVMRLGSLCESNDRAAILSNVNSALKYVGNSRTGKDSNRWREIGSLDTGSRSRHLYIDLKTFDDANNTSVKLWVKQTKSSEGQGPYSVQRYELNCGSRQMRTLSVASYDALGNLNFTREGDPQWESIVPDTMGEQLASGACQSN
jgi:hypothetical protein